MNPSGNHSPTRLALLGATGRMGRAVLHSLPEGPGLLLGGALARPGHPELGRPADQLHPGVLLVDDAAAALRDAQVALDFSRAEAVGGHLAACVAARVPLVIAVTGLDAVTQRQVDEAARSIAVLPAANTSLGVAVMSRIAGLAAACLPGFDIEIAEAHHRLKRDAPSGTALQLGEAIARARGRELADIAVYSRHGNTPPRQADQLGFSVQRAGDIVGNHTVLYAGRDETLEITHRAADRSCFARGALAAAAWLAERPPGLYCMQDVLGF